MMKEHQDGEKREKKDEAFSDEYDVAILGGGIAGMTLALELKKTRPATRILVVEKQKHPVPEAAYKVGESTVEIQAHYLRSVLGLQEHLQTQQLPKFGLRMFFSFDDNRDITRRVELGHAVLPPRRVATYQLDRGRLENTLGRELPCQHVTFLDDCKVQQVSLQPQDDFHRLLIHDTEGDRKIRSRWVVDASGRNKFLQKQLGLVKKVDHHANAVWFRVGSRINVNTWSNDPAWLGRIREGERWLSTNHLMGPGYWVWLIPLSSGSTSVGIVTDASMHSFDEMNRFERALDWLHQHEPQCAEDIEQHLDKIQDFRIMKNYSYSCEQVFSDERWCLIGEAAVSLDPLYSPGGDLIAIANGLVCDLIAHALDGEEKEAIEERAAIHNNIFLLFTNSWLGTYDQQYPIMGNAQIMAAKVIWDTAVYWAIPGLLYFHDKIRRLADSPALIMLLARFSALSDHVQKFFREWCVLARADASDVFIKYYDFDFTKRLQIGMTAELPDAALEAQFAANIHFMEQLAGQLVATVTELFAHSSDKAVQDQIRRWQTDEFLTELVALYQQADLEHPINSGWITLGRQEMERQEVVG
jgi:flavin-dependent dehydrogenase